MERLKVKPARIHLTLVMRYPSLQNPEGFGDIFPILIVYVAIMSILVQISDSTIIRWVFILGTILFLGWATWAIFSILDTGIEEDHFQ